VTDFLLSATKLSISRGSVPRPTVTETIGKAGVLMCRVCAQTPARLGVPRLVEKVVDFSTKSARNRNRRGRVNGTNATQHVLLTSIRRPAKFSGPSVEVCRTLPIQISVFNTRAREFGWNKDRVSGTTPGPAIPSHTRKGGVQ
jgi:hypothetical protein